MVPNARLLRRINRHYLEVDLARELEGENTAEEMSFKWCLQGPVTNLFQDLRNFKNQYQSRYTGLAEMH